MSDLSKIYRSRFESTGLEKRHHVWKVLCESFFQSRVGTGKSVLDLACGYGEFINNIAASEKFGADLNADAAQHLARNVTFLNTSATDLSGINDGQLDVVFTSNFLEHLPDKETCSAVFSEVRRILKVGGRFIILGPNIRYAYREYWDYYDHYLPLSHHSLVEGLSMAGYSMREVIPRFLPYTMKGRMPAHPLLVRAYLKFPPSWAYFGKQFLVVGEKLG